jgi:hypothetical protein
MPGTRHETDDTAKSPQVTEAAHPHEDDEQDPTTLKFSGPVRLSDVSDEDVGSDPYNRTGRFRRLIR